MPENTPKEKLRWGEKDKRCLFCFKLADGKSVSFQTTSKAAGSREAAERIAHRCYEKFQMGASKQEVTAYRDELYQEEARARAAAAPVRVKPEASKVELKVERSHEVQSSAAPYNREDCKGWGAHVFWCFVAATSAGSADVPRRQCHSVLPHKVIAQAFRGAKSVLGEGTGWEAIHAVWATQWWAKARLRELELAAAGLDSRLHLQDVAELLANFQATVVEASKAAARKAKVKVELDAATAGAVSDRRSGRKALRQPCDAVNGKEKNHKAEVDATTATAGSSKRAGRKASREVARNATVKVELGAATAGAVSDRRSGRKAVNGKEKNHKASKEATHKAHMKAEVDATTATAGSSKRAGRKASEEAARKAKVKVELDAATAGAGSDRRSGRKAANGKDKNDKASTEAAHKANVKAAGDKDDKGASLCAQMSGPCSLEVCCGVCGTAVERKGSCQDCTSTLSAQLGLRHAVGDRVWCSGYGPRWPAQVDMISFDGAEDTEPYCVSFYGEKTKAWVSEAKLIDWGSIKPSRPAKRWQRRFDVALAAAEGAGK
eukprot:s434_g3.t2